MSSFAIGVHDEWNHRRSSCADSQRGGDLDIIKIHALIKTGESRGGIRGKFKDYIQRRVIPSFFLSAKVNCKLRFNTRLTGKFNRDYSTISASYFLFSYELRNKHFRLLLKVFVTLFSDCIFKGFLLKLISQWYILEKF